MASPKEDIQKDIEHRILDYEEEIMCAKCGTHYEEAKSFHLLDTGDFVCSKKCFIEYAVSYFTITTVKGKDIDITKIK